MTDPALTTPPTTLAPHRGAPVPPRRAARAQARTVRRVVRRIEPRSAWRVSLWFYACLGAALLGVGVLLWLVAAAFGVIGHVETFVGDLFALEDFHFEPLWILLVSVVGTAVLVLVGAGLTVGAAVLYNAIADRSGGIECTMIDEEGSHSVV